MSSAETMRLTHAAMKELQRRLAAVETERNAAVARADRLCDIYQQDKEDWITAGIASGERRAMAAMKTRDWHAMSKFKKLLWALQAAQLIWRIRNLRKDISAYVVATETIERGDHLTAPATPEPVPSAANRTPQ